MSGLLIVISSPTGGGKTTIIREILRRFPDQYVYSISATTRKPRPGEIDGKDYFFLSEKQFLEDVKKNRFLEWENVHGYYYGTDSAHIEKCLRQGKHVLLDLDVNGALKLAKKFKGKVITIFLAPPSMDELIKRLKNRKTDSKDEIEKRLKRIPMEMEKSRQFDYVIVNKELDKTVREIIKVVNDNISKT